MIIDTSRWQGLIDWMRVAPQIEGAFIKATGADGGKLYTDGKFTLNWQGAKQAGVRRGAYHFLNAAMDGAVQADYYLQAVADAGAFKEGEFLPCVDCEHPLHMTTGMDVIEAFVLRVEMHAKATPIIYTGAWWWNPLVGDKAWARRCPLWLAAYVKVCPPPPAPWEKVSMHQYTDHAAIEGIEGNVDGNRLLVPLAEVTF